MERIRFFNIIFYRVIISRSLETDRKFTKVCSTRRKVKIVRVSSGINLKDLRICDKHYSSLSARAHKPPRGKSSTRSCSDAQLGILKVTPCIVPCSQCGNKVCLSSDVPCKKHHINIFKNTFSVGCNFLDERTGKTDLRNDLYSVDACDGTFPDYICMSCQPFYLKSIIIEHEYKTSSTKNEVVQFPQ